MLALVGLLDIVHHIPDVAIGGNSSVWLTTVSDVKQRLPPIDSSANGTTLNGLADRVERIMRDPGSGLEVVQGLRRGSHSGGSKSQEGAEDGPGIHFR
jgi:hypothetical protein